MKPVVLIVLDGWGLGKKYKGNAVHVAKTPNYDRLVKEYPFVPIGAAGEYVGLKKGHQGASEIGHFVMGCGRNSALPQFIVLNAFKSGAFLKNKAFLKAMKHVKKNNSTLHLAGLLSDKGVHSYDETCFALIEMAKNNGVKDLVVHVITDGRDTTAYEAKKYIRRLQKVLKKNNLGRIGTVIGRYWIMDRDHRWKRVEKGYNALVKGIGYHKARNAIEAIEEVYKIAERERKENKFVESDEFIKPTIIVDEKDRPVGKVKDKDAFIWFNFRTDRSIEITQAFVEPRFSKFKRKKRDVLFVCMMQYYKAVPALIALKKTYPKKTLGEILSKHKLKQLRIAETEKWIYLTTIFNGMEEKPFKGEDRILVPSDKIATYDLKPKMQAEKITEKTVQAINSKKYDAIFVNYANADILTHTGKIKAVVKGLETVDKGLGKIVKAVKKANGTLLITADHGGAEEMLSRNGTPHIHHTTSKVPLILVSENPELKKARIRKGSLRDIAPTVLDIMGIPKPREMTGKSLLER